MPSKTASKTANRASPKTTRKTVTRGRGRPSLPDSQRRDVFAKVCLTQVEHDRLQADARKLGLSMSDLLHQRAIS